MQSSTASKLTVADYDRALEMWPTEIVRRARNVTIAPTWIGGPGDERFWFRRETPQGHEFVVVDAATGAQRSGYEVPDAPVPDRGVVRAPNGRGVFIRDFNLWLREPDGRERAVTTTGSEFYGWGMPADMRLTKIAESRAPQPQPVIPRGCVWAPDSRHLLTQQMDEREVPPYPYLESVPADGSRRPIVHWIRQELAGEPRRGQSRWYVIDVDGGRQSALALPAGCEDLQPTVVYNGGAWWAPDSRTVYVLAASPGSDHVALLAVDGQSGAARVVHEERVATFFDFNTLEYNAPNVRLLAERCQALWYSQRSGWGHLYLLDLAQGGVVRQVTDGDWAVFDVIEVDGDYVYFSAGGREPGRHPYYRHLYRARLDGEAPNAGLTLLTPEDADHGFPGNANATMAVFFGVPQRQPFSPSRRYFIDCYSRVDLPSRTVIRRADGTFVAEVASADVSELEAHGWKPPEIFTAKAADGETDLYGVFIKPRNFDPSRRWPVLERIYGGPQINAQPRSFLEGLNGAFVHAMQALAELGFVIAILDGPGTPYRSKAFHDLTWDSADRWGIAHHRAALEDAARTRPWMDLSNVGISGHSYGGYATAMALLLQGDFYKVGVSTAGMYDPMWAHRSVPMRHLGRPRFASGKDTFDTPDATAENYVKFSPSTYADRLTGKLMLAYGDLDENIQPAALLKFIDSLIRAGKHYDLLYLPGRNHGFVPEPYFQKRLWDYFLEHVQGREPQLHHRLNVQAGQRTII